MKYNIGTVTVTNGDATVTGDGSQDFASNLAPGELFTVISSGITYTIASVTDSQHFELSANYAGATDAAASYTVVQGFTTHFSIPYPDPGDVQTATIVKRAMVLIDNILVPESATAAQLADSSADINTKNKFLGAMAWDSTNNEPVWATGAAAADAWKDAIDLIGSTGTGPIVRQNSPTLGVIMVGGATTLGTSVRARFGDSTNQNYVVVDGGTVGEANGAAFRVQNGGADVLMFGNRSACLGGGYDANPSVVIPSGDLLILSGSNTELARFQGPGGFRTGVPVTVGVDPGFVGAASYIAHRDVTAQYQGPGVFWEKQSSFGDQAGVLAVLRTEDAGLTHSAWILQQLGADRGYIQDLIRYDLTTHNCHFGATARVIIHEQGLMAGTTTVGGWNAVGQIVSVVGGSAWAFSAQSLGGGGSSGLYLANVQDDTSYIMGINYRDNAIGSIMPTSGGTGTAYNTSSDARLKENIVDADDAGDIIDGLRVRAWDWKSNGRHEAFGFVAQEEYLVFPAGVTKGDDDPTTIAQQWHRDDSKVVPLLVKEVQSLRVRMTALEARTV